MKVRVAGIRRSDLVRTIPYMFVNQRSSWITAGILAVMIVAGVVGMRVVENEEITVGGLEFIAAGAVVGALVALTAGLLVRLAFVAAIARKAALLESYTMTLGDDGLHTASERGETLLKWTAVGFVRRTRNYLFIGTTPYAVILVPVRMFASREDSEAFWLRTCDLSRAAAKKPRA